MNEPDAYPRQLERLLQASAAARGDTRHIEVINAGVVGYSTIRRPRTSRSKAGSTQPDLVLVNYYPVNDTHNKLSEVSAARAALQRPAPVAARPVRVPAEALSAPVHQRRAAHAEAEGRRAARARGREGRGRGQGRPRAGRGRLDRRLPRGSRGWEAVRTALRATSAQQSKAHGVPVLWSFCPTRRTWSATTSASTRRSRRWWRAPCAMRAWRYFDLEPTFAPWQGKEDEVLLPAASATPTPPGTADRAGGRTSRSRAGIWRRPVERWWR